MVHSSRRSWWVLILLPALALVIPACGDAGSDAATVDSDDADGAESNADESDEPDSDEEDSDDGDSESGGGAGDLIPASAAQTQALESFGFSMSIVIDGDIPDAPGVDSVEFSAEGAFDNASGASYFAVDMGSLFDALSGNLESTDQEFYDLLGPEGLNMEFISDGEYDYLRMPFLTALDPSLDPETWLRTETASSAEFEMGTSTENFDPTNYLEMLEQAGEVEELGTDTIDGVEVQGYRVEIDVEQILAAEGDDPDADLEAFVEELGVDEVPTFPIDVWVDSDEYVRRFVMTADGGGFLGAGMSDPAASGGDATMTLTMDFFGFNEEVLVEIPEEWVDMDEMDLFGLGTAFGDDLEGLEGLDLDALLEEAGT